MGNDFFLLMRRVLCGNDILQPEIEPLPADLSNKLSELQQMCILRSLRPDRVLFAANRFVASNLGNDYADPPAFDLRLIYKSSSARTPLIFVLSPGVDPTAQVGRRGRRV